MKLLFDQNLSPRLVRLLADLFPGSTHVRDVGLGEADDVTIWTYAGLHGYTIVSKDSDFQQRSLLNGAPPKFIWLSRKLYRLNNRKHTENVLCSHTYL